MKKFLLEHFFETLLASMILTIVLLVVFDPFSPKRYEPFSVVCSPDGYYAPVNKEGYVSDWAASTDVVKAIFMAETWREKSRNPDPVPVYPKRDWRPCE